MKRTITLRTHSRDVSLPRMLYAKILLSPHAHARIKHIDASRAKSIVEVRDILTYDDSDIAFDNESGPIFEMSRNSQCDRQVGARLPHNSR
jgi:CO/xanthine dehydrogenase Mo-binding subunit